jgi:hypothetical protein
MELAIIVSVAVLGVVFLMGVGIWLLNRLNHY